MRKDTLAERLILTSKLLLVVATLKAQPLGPQLPGWWRQGAYYVPCPPNAHAYGTYAAPDTGFLFYLGFDANTNQILPGQHGICTQGANHATMCRGDDDKWYPVQGEIAPGQTAPPNYFPAPPPEANLCAQYASYGNTAACPTSTLALYGQKIAGTWLYTVGWNAYKPQRAAHCSGVQPTATPAVTVTQGGPPSKTPTMACCDPVPPNPCPPGAPRCTQPTKTPLPGGVTPTRSPVPAP